MENEEDPTKLTGGFLTFLFIYFYVIIRSVWAFWTEFSPLKADYFIVNNQDEAIIMLCAIGISAMLGIISILMVIWRKMYALAILRLSVIFMLAYSLADLFIRMYGFYSTFDNILKLARPAFLLIFTIYLCRRSFNPNRVNK